MGTHYGLCLAVISIIRLQLVQGAVREVSIMPDGKTMNSISANFGYQFEKDISFTAKGVYAEPEDLCTGPTNYLEVIDKIVVVLRGNCFFETKAVVGSFAGAKAVIIVDPGSTAYFASMMPGDCLDDSMANLPVVIIKSKTDSAWLRDTILAEGNNVLDITIRRTGAGLGDSCSTWGTKCSSPLGHECSDGSCICNTPYFVDAVPSGCDRDPTQSLDAISGRPTDCDTLYDLNESGCAPDENQCRYFPDQQCVDDVCVCPDGYQDDGAGQCEIKDPDLEAAKGGQTVIPVAAQTTVQPTVQPTVQTTAETTVKTTVETTVATTRLTTIDAPLVTTVDMETSTTSLTSPAVTSTLTGSTRTESDETSSAKVSTQYPLETTSATSEEPTTEAPKNKTCSCVSFTKACYNEIDGELLSEYPNLSVVTCFGECYEIASCNNFGFNVANRTCVLYRTEYEGWPLSHLDGWTFYTVSRCQ